MADLPGSRIGSWKARLGDSGRTATRHAISLRSPGFARPPDRPAAPGAALPHQGAELFAEGCARQSFRQLAAGPARQLAGALRLSGKDRGIQRRGRPHRRTRGDQSLRLLRRALRGGISVHIPRRVEERARRQSRRRTRRPAADAIRRGPVGAADPDDRFSGRIECATAKEDRLCDPHGAGRPGARRDAGAGVGLVPRFGVAARADHAPPRPRREVRVGLSDPAQSRTSIRSRGRRGRTTISPTCTPGRKSTYPAPAGSAST